MQRTAPMTPAAIEPTTEYLRALPGDDVRPILWRFAARYDLQMLDVVFVDVGPGVGAARTDVAPRRVEIGERPVDQVHVQVVELQVGQRLAEGRDDIASGVLIVPELAGDPKLLARDAAGDDLAQGEANAVLIAIDAGAIEVAVAHLGGALDSRGDFVGGDVVAAEGAQSDGRHSGAGVESSLGNEGGVDGSCIHENGTNFHVSAEKSKKCEALSLTTKAKSLPDGRGLRGEPRPSGSVTRWKN